MRRYVGVLFLDLKNAFDTLNHGIELRKLEHYAIRGVVNDVIRGYQENGSQLVSYAGQINVEVPQGSNIGPLLFLTYINDISKLHLTGAPRSFSHLVLKKATVHVLGIGKLRDKGRLKIFIPKNDGCNK